MKDDVNDDDDDDDDIDAVMVTVLRGRSDEVACGVEFEWTTRLFWS